jgi:hypothetical protein
MQIDKIMHRNVKIRALGDFVRRLDLTSFARRSIAPGAIKTNINNQVWSTRKGKRKLLLQSRRISLTSAFRVGD